jgi:hypothetical protein
MGGGGTEQVMRGLSPHFTSVSCHRRRGERGGGADGSIAIDSSRLAVSVSVHIAMQSCTLVATRKFHSRLEKCLMLELCWIGGMTRCR